MSVLDAVFSGLTGGSVGVVPAGGVGCARCGAVRVLVADVSEVVSRRFTAWEGWVSTSGRVCGPCAWGYRGDGVRSSVVVVTQKGAAEVVSAAEVGVLLSAGGLPAWVSVVVPVKRRVHLLPLAQWGRVTTDAGVLPWDAECAARLGDVAWLRSRGVSGLALRDGSLGLPVVQRNVDELDVLLSRFRLAQSWFAAYPVLELALAVTVPDVRSVA